MFSGVHASTSHVHACSPACKPAQGSCTHVLRRASQHKTRARMFCGVQASTRLVHACSAACKPAQGLCTHVLRRASQHEACARMFCGVQASTRLVRACSPACKPAQDSCTHVLRRAGQHKADARMQSRVLACTPEVPARREFERYADQRFWQGDSVTHCETRADGRHHQFHKPNRVPGSSEKLHLVKHFTPASDETIIYQFTLKTVPNLDHTGQFAGDTFQTTCLVRDAGKLPFTVTVKHGFSG